MAVTYTRLRYVASTDPQKIEEHLRDMQYPVSVRSVQNVSGKWFCWYVLDHMLSRDLPSVDLDRQTKKVKARVTK